MLKSLLVLTFLLLYQSHLWANMSYADAEKLLQNNTLEGQEAGIIIDNPDGGYLCLITNINALRDGSQTLSLIAWPPMNARGIEMIDNTGDVGHTSLILSRTNQIEASYGKYPAHQLRAAFILAAITLEPIEGEIVKRPADYLSRKMRSKNHHGITFLLTGQQFQQIEQILENDVKHDHVYHLNCDNCSSWAITRLQRINIDFEKLVGPIDATPWEIFTYIANEKYLSTNDFLANTARNYQGIHCANPVDISKSLYNFWKNLGIEQVPLSKKNKEALQIKEQNFLEQLGYYLGVSLQELELSLASNGMMNITTQGSFTQHLSPHFSALDFAIDADLLATKDPIYLNRALLTLLGTKFDLSGIRASGDALGVMIKQEDQVIQVINHWLGIQLQISFYLDPDRTIRLMIQGSIALESSNSAGFQLPLSMKAMIQLGQFIIHYTYQQEHRLRFEITLNEQDSLFIQGKLHDQKVKINLGYRHRY